jgi:enoyl-CoA hydratase
MTTSTVTIEMSGPVAIARLDDGKANALSHQVIDELETALTKAESSEARAVVIVGRPGKFSAGFDLATMQAGPAQARELLRVGAELAIRIYTFPCPVVLGVTGHALAMGAILLMAADVRIGADGPFKIGLNEVAIGMPVPKFAVEFADDRLSRRHLTAAVNHAHIFDPASAVDAGYLDRVVEPESVEAAAVEHATTLASALNPAAFRLTRSNLRDERTGKIRAGLSADVASFAIES